MPWKRADKGRDALAHWTSCWLLAVSLGSIACEEREDPPNASEIREALVPPGPKSEQQSPNARILPEPLQEPDKLADPDDQVEDDIPQAPRPRPKPERWSTTSVSTEDRLPGVLAAGYRLDTRVVWPEGERRITLKKEDYELWPLFRIELARELRDRPALSRWVLENRVFSLPQGTELRGRADRLGTMVVWPDRRSYRVAQPGALRAVFEDRRVDRMPFVEAKVTRAGEGTRLGRSVQRLKLETPLGAAHLEFVELADLPYAAPLLCRELLEFVRVQTRPEICAPGQLLVRMFVEWDGGGQWLLEVVRITPVQDLEIEDFRTPPPLPIFKRGELPPFDPEIIPTNQKYAVLPLKGPGEDMLPDPPAPPPLPDNKALPSEPDPSSLLPADMLVLKNDTNRPLLVFLQRLPTLWLFPGQQEKLRVSAAPLHVMARDFLGEIVSDHAMLTAPREVKFTSARAFAATSSAP